MWQDRGMNILSLGMLVASFTIIDYSTRLRLQRYYIFPQRRMDREKRSRFGRKTSLTVAS